MRNGVLVGGNWIIDQVKVIDKYPTQEALANILAEYTSNGGSAYNILKDLRRLNVPFPLEGIGLVGDDILGNRIIAECKLLNIKSRQLRKTKLAHTSYTDVMSVKCNGRRTFFHQRGANALLSERDFELESSASKIFHLGYMLLLDKLDIVDENGTTGASRILKKAKESGHITTADLVSEDSDRFSSVIPPALPYIDYLFVNEFEAQMLTGIVTSNDEGEVLRDCCYKAALKIHDMGVGKWVIIHFPSGIVAVDNVGKMLFQPCIKVPVEKIEGAVGAGDAFAAGVLMGIHENWDMQTSLQLGVCAAATSLFAATSSDGIQDFKQCISMIRQYGYRTEAVPA